MQTQPTLQQIVSAIFLFCSTFSFGASKDAVISLNLQDVQLASVFKIIAQKSPYNIIVSPKIDRKISIHLDHVTWREALDSLVKNNGLVCLEEPHILTIITKDELPDETSRLKTELFKLRYQPASQIVQQIKELGILSKHGKIAADLNANNLSITDQPEILAKIVSLIKDLDKHSVQIFIEAFIVTVDTEFAKNLGLELNTQQSPLKPLATNEMRYTLAKLNNATNLNLELDALEREGHGKVISKPRLLASNHQTAYIETGAEIPYHEKNRHGDLSTSFKKAVLSLKITPDVLTEQNINLAIEVHQDKVGHLQIEGQPTIDTQKIQTKVTTGNHETIVLGGIYEQQKRTIKSGVPILRDLPLLRFLFSRTQTKLEKRELLIFVTPHLLYPGQK